MDTMEAANGARPLFAYEHKYRISENTLTQKISQTKVYRGYKKSFFVNVRQRNVETLQIYNAIV